MITVTGMGSIELNKVGPFLKQAFSDYGYLTRKSKGDEGRTTVGGSNEYNSTTTTMGSKIVQESQTALSGTSTTATDDI